MNLLPRKSFGVSSLSSRLVAALALLSMPSWAVADGFTDRAAESGVAFRYFNGMTGELLFPEIMGGGAALFDFDRDGDLDIYLAQGEILRPERSGQVVFPRAAGEVLGDRLLRSDTVAGASWPHFVDVSSAAGLEPGGYGMGVSVADFDNDGWQDLYVLNFGPNRLLRNRGDGTFVDVTESAGVGEAGWSTAASWLDYDGDGWLDLFVGSYSDYSLATHKACFSESGELDYCSPSVFPPAHDALLRNLGDGTFERRTKRAGLGATSGPALGAATGDFNGDGRLDLYVANDGVPNQLWVNLGDGRLADEAVLAGVAVNAAGRPEASMGVVAADFDSDGLEDLFMTHLTRETNTLYLGSAEGYFSDVSAGSGLAMPSWKNTGFGVGLADFDLDGELDLFIANGAVRRIERLARAGDPYPLALPNQYFRGRGDGSFEEASQEAGPAVSRELVSRGVAAGDLDNDGDVDLLVVNSEGPAQLLDNSWPQGGDWQGLSILTQHGAPGLGGEVRKGLGDGRSLLRRVSSGGSYASAGDPRIVLGAPSPTAVIEVRLPGATRRRWHELPSDHYLVVPTP